MTYKIRYAIGVLISPILAATGFRFSKLYRHEDTWFHAAVYAVVDTVGANCRAEILTCRKLRKRIGGVK